MLATSIQVNVQVLWSPNDVQRCVVLTQHDQLLLGDLGRELQAVYAISHAACAAWSPDGRFLVFGWGDEVHVYDTASSTECWSTQIVPQAVQVPYLGAPLSV